MNKMDKKLSDNSWLIGLSTELAFVQALSRSRTLQVMTAIAIIVAALFFTFLVYNS